MVSNFAKRGAVVGLVVAMSAAVSNGQIVINEVDYDQPGSDTLEYVELQGAGNADLAGWTLVLYNGNGGGAYTTIDLDFEAGSLPADGYLVIGSALVPDVDVVSWVSNGIQNGNDGVVLCSGGVVVDSVSYEGVFDATDGCASGSTLPDSDGVNDASAADTSISRCDDGSGGFQLRTSTPGATNDCPAGAIGACCTDGTVCEDNVEEANCMGVGQVFTDATACNALGTPCVPANDECVDRIEILDGTTLFDNAGATSSNEPDNPCPGSSADWGNDLWYNYTATCTGTLTIDACEVDSNLAIAIYDGTACPLSAADLLGCDDDNFGGNPACPDPTDEGPHFEVQVVSGNTYKIRMGHWQASPGFDFTAVVTLDCAAPPIPTVSEWGFIVMCLLIACAGTVVFRGHRATSKQ
jgi:Lamin Tail Domain